MKHQKYRESHRESLRAKQRAYSVSPAGREKQHKYEKSPKGIVAHYRNASKRRGIAWALPYGLAVDLVTDNCFYCGAPPNPTNGIDRVVNAEGYLENNVVTACGHCNKAKLERTREEFEQWVVCVVKQLGAGKFYPFPS